MSMILQTILSMSLTGSVVILCVLAARLLLRRSPRIFSYVLWGVVLFRLLCPVSFVSSLSLFGIAEKESIGTAGMDKTPETLPQADGNAVWTAQPQPDIKEAGSSYHSTDDGIERVNALGMPWSDIFTGIWFLGAIGMLCYSAYGYLCTRRLFAGGRCKGGNIYEINWEVSPFVLGVVRPKICLPYWLEGQEREYVLLHEKTHIKRGDHIVKMLAFLALSLHWFNPLVWLAFFLAEKDMEMSCDESVMRRMQADARYSYAESLLNLSAGKRRLPGGLLAFGEGGIKERIQNIMRYKKPTVSAVIVAAFVLAVCAVSLGSNPKNAGAAPIADDTEKTAKAENQNDTDNIADEINTENAGSVSKEQYSEEYSEVFHVLTQWAQAFCGRDGDVIAALSAEEVKQSLSDQELLEITSGGTSFGFSSPWMWDDKQDYRIIEWKETGTEPMLVTAEILYYAWTSDPHVTVWKQTLALQQQGDSFQVTMEELRYLDNICTGEEFLSAYPNSVYSGGIAESRMDYLTNGMGQFLNENALLASSNYYKDLFAPDTAAVALLNLLDNQNKVTTAVGAENKDGSVVVEITFQEDGTVFEVTMARPYGEDGYRYGIWIPQSYVRK